MTNNNWVNSIVGTGIVLSCQHPLINVNGSSKRIGYLQKYIYNELIATILTPYGKNCGGKSGKLQAIHLRF